MKLSSAHLSEEISDVITTEQTGLSEGSVLISSEEMVLMQTANTDIMKTKSNKGVTSRLLLDSGSQRTYITEKLAAKLGLKSECEKELKPVTFGSDKTKVIKTKSTKISVQLNSGNYEYSCKYSADYQWIDTKKSGIKVDIGMNGKLS